MAIIVGYQGIGKSSVCNGSGMNVDLESSNFFVEGKRGEDWVQVYVNMAINLNNQGKNVFMSSHKAVREELKRRGQEFLCIFPEDTPEMMEWWIERLEKRYNSDQSNKNLKALANAQQMYSENIKDLSQEKWTYVIKYEDLDMESDLPFNLFYVVNEPTLMYSDAHKYDGKFVKITNGEGSINFGKVNCPTSIGIHTKGRYFALMFSIMYEIDYHCGTKHFNALTKTTPTIEYSKFNRLYSLECSELEDNITVISEQEFNELVEQWHKA